MALQPVSDPALLEQLNASEMPQGLRAVSDPTILAQLNGQQLQAPPPSFGKQLLSAAVRPIAKGLGALPLMAMDAGVGARNLITGSRYDMPSKMFNDSLDQYTLKPEGIGKAAEFVSSSLVSGALGFPQAARQVPGNFVKPAANATEETLRAGQQAGYVAPPAQANPTLTARVAEGLAGKTSVAQAASSHNQSVTNQLAKRAIGLADDVPLTREVLSTVRSQAGQAYKAVAESGDIVPDGQFLDELAQLGRSADEIAKDFPDANVAASKEIGDLTNSLLRDKFSAKSAMEYLKELRKQASSNLSFQSSADPAKRALGMAQREAAATLEDLTVRRLTQQGRPDLAEAFDQARKLIAKTYSVESALNESTGNVVATALGGQLKRDKPLSGDLELAARFARTFPKATREVNESLPFLSPWDFGWGGIGSVVAGNPLPAAYPFARMGLRKWLLSPQGQRMAAGQGVLGQVPPGMVMGSLPAAQQLTQ